MARVLARIRENPRSVRFWGLYKVCDNFLGEPRRRGMRHRAYKTPSPGDPRVNFHNYRRKAKAYQVKQLFKAIDRLEAGDVVEE